MTTGIGRRSLGYGCIFRLDVDLGQGSVWWVALFEPGPPGTSLIEAIGRTRGVSRAPLIVNHRWGGCQRHWHPLQITSDVPIQSTFGSVRVAHSASAGGG